MKIFVSGVVLVLLGLGWVVPAAHAQGCSAPEGGQIVVYFEVDGQLQRSKDSPGAGLDVLSVFGEGFPAAFASGVQYRIDYGPHLSFVADGGLPPVSIGNSQDGISIGFGLMPRPGLKFFIQTALVMWNDECDEGTENSDFPIVGPHPDFPDATPIVTRFPDSSVLVAHGARSQTCQHVELDVKPGSCPNPFNVKLWDWAAGAGTAKGGVLPVAILGSSTVDVSTIDASSVRLMGVVPLATGHGIVDVSTLLANWWERADDCVCNDGDGDGFLDLTFKFNTQDIAAAIPEGSVGDVIALTLTGCYNDGMPFSATDCITVVGKAGKGQPHNDTALGFPNPNPFNPVTRISYAIPTTQHVRLAIYDVAGRLVVELVNEVKNAGEYVVEWDAGNMSSGVYFYRLRTGTQTVVRRATLLK